MLLLLDWSVFNIHALSIICMLLHLASCLTHLAPDRLSLPAVFPYRETPDRPVAAG